MRLEDLRVDLRPRPPGQAVELGAWLVHGHARRIWPAWLAAWIPVCALALALSFLPDGMLWATLFLMWIRPLPERMVIAVLAHGTFGQELGIRDAFLSVWRHGRSGLVRFLTWGRPFGIARCLQQPTWQLEGSDRDLARRRASSLGEGGAIFSAILWGSACSVFESFLALGAILFAGLFAPGRAINPFALFSAIGGEDLPQTLVTFFVSCIGFGMAVVGPFYVAGGFSLYLSRRARLEAWDIEIALRRLSGRLQKGVLPLVLLLVALAGQARAEECPDSLRQAPSKAQRFATRAPSDREVSARIDSIMRQDEYRDWECSRHWILRHPDTTTASTPEDGQRLGELFGNLLGNAAPYMKWAFIAIFCGWLAWLVWTHRDLVRVTTDMEDGSSGASSQVAPVVREVPLPSDPAGMALSLWAKGDRRGALSLLYRATVQILSDRHGLNLAKGSTEGLCLRGLAAKDPSLRKGAEPVVRAWMQAAWAGRWPDDEGFQGLVAQWRNHLGAHG